MRLLYKIFFISSIFVLQLCFANSSYENNQSTDKDSLSSFYIIDTIEIKSPKLLYLNERQNSMDKFTSFVLTNKAYEEIDFSKVRKAEELLKDSRCFVFQSYSTLLSTLSHMGEPDSSIIFQGRSLQLGIDSCKAITKHISVCNLIGLRNNIFVIGLLRTEDYNYYRVLEHKKIDLSFKFVLIAYPLR